MPALSRRCHGATLPVLFPIVLITMLAAGRSPATAASPTRPVIPGYSRIHGFDDADPVDAGRLLLTELNCTSCHRLEGEAAQRLKPKPAPILDSVGSRVQLQWLQDFLASTHETKAGTTMPDLFAGFSEEEQSRAVMALTHFLSQTGRVVDGMANTAAVKRGEQLFHTIGCLGCHSPVELEAKPLPHSAPLGSLTDKYSIGSLTAFLSNPLAVRRGGRMPDFMLDDKQARDLACYVFRNVEVPANVRFTYYEGRWNELPDFGTLQPKTQGNASGFNIGARERNDGFGIRFFAFIHIPKDATYRFFLGSDDGSRLSIDGETVINNDGVHAHSVQSGRHRLSAGAHSVQVDYFENSGDESLTVEIEGPGLPRQPLGSIASITEEKPEPRDGGDAFTFDEQLAAEGRKLFESIGCASCHQLKLAGKDVSSTLQTTKLKELSQLDSGCLSSEPQKGLPDYQLSEAQRKHLTAAITALQHGPREASSEESIHRTMARFNCYACHERNETGGVADARHEFFTSTMKEMGDEGRIPPKLDGVGDKLTEQWLKGIFDKGSDDRPYMLTKMPKFGGGNVGHLTEAFRDIDLKTAAEIPEYSLPDSKMKAAGRKLSGEKALACIKCHTFNGSKALGIQSIDLTIMARRLREDWFHRYMRNPQIYRRGTRMPAPWPGGVALIEDVLDGDADKQMHAVWLYLTDGTKAGVPPGLIKGAIVLKPEDRPRIYRNFIDGVSPRGIAVGYPEQVNLCFDAEDISLALIWENAFIDASKHWNGRGQGRQRPLGDNIYSLVRGVPFAALESETVVWPKAPADEQGYEFRGYRFNADREPVFLYSKDRIAITDEILPEKVKGPLSGFERTLTLESPSPVDDTLWYRAAAGSAIERKDGEFLIDGRLHIDIEGGADERAVLRTSDGRMELLIPLRVNNGTAQITQSYHW